MCSIEQGPHLSGLHKSLQQKNYGEFSIAFKRLKQQARQNPRVKHALIEVHNSITEGATKRILPSERIEVSQLNMSEYLFKLYTSRY